MAALLTHTLCILDHVICLFSITQILTHQSRTHYNIVSKVMSDRRYDFDNASYDMLRRSLGQMFDEKPALDSGESRISMLK